MNSPAPAPSVPRARSKAAKAGLRALEACGDGFWEFDLVAGSAWFNDWFYRKLNWPRDAKRSTLSDLQPVICVDAWDRLMGMFRDHLEKGSPLDLELEVEVQGERHERWRMRGSAERNDAGQPIYLAGSMQEVNDTPQTEAVSLLSCLGGAFDALPVAAALLDARAILIAANQLWRRFPEATAGHAIARLRAANSQTAIEFWLDEEAEGAGSRSLRVRAIAFQHAGSRHLAVTLEDRRSD